jgi:hypothetical protein
MPFKHCGFLLLPVVPPTKRSQQQLLCCRHNKGKESMLYLQQINRYNTHAVLSFITDALLWEFPHCKAVYDNIIYRYKYVTDFRKVVVTFCTL